MMRKWIRRWGWQDWCFLAASVLVCGSLAGILSPQFRQFVQDPAVYGWASALGTFGAVATALWVSLGEARLREQERKRGVEVFRWLLGADLARVVSTVEEVEVALVKLEAVEIGVPIPAEINQFLRVLLERFEAVTWERHLPQLAHFEPDIAQAIAEIMGCLPTYIFNLRLLSQPRLTNQAVANLVATVRSRNAAILRAARRTQWLE